MITLAEHQFELLPDETSTAGVGFGIGLNVSVDEDGFDPGDAEWAVQDTINPVTGSRNFGRDVLAGPAWTFALHVNRDDVATALTSLGELRTAWKAGSVIGIPGRTSILRYRIGGRDRRVYGRPRRWAAPPNNRILGGYVPITTTFQTADALHYADLETMVDIGYVATSAGGFEFPVEFPVATLPPGQRDGLATVGGDSPTYPIIRFNGPIINPKLACAAWSVQLNMELLAGQYVEIDTRPWKLSVLRQGVYNEGGKLSRQARLRNLTLSPGNVEFVFSGNSVAGTASCIVKWRDAYASL